MSLINTVLIDDEQEASDSLEILLSGFPQVKILKKITNPIDVFPVLINSKIDLIFLDIKMPNISGLDLLAKIRECNPFVTVVIVTAFDNYTMNAIKLHVFSYLLKPVSRVELNSVVEKILTLYDKNVDKSVISPSKKVFIKSKKEMLIVEASDVVYFEAEGNYTTIYLKNGKTIMASYNMGTLVDKFSENEFVKANRSLIVNKNCILSVNKKEKKCVVTLNNQQVILKTSNNFLKELNTIF